MAPEPALKYHDTDLEPLVHPLSQADAGGLTKVPVLDLARVLAVERETVYRDLEKLTAEVRIDSLTGEMNMRRVRHAPTSARRGG